MPWRGRSNSSSACSPSSSSPISSSLSLRAVAMRVRASFVSCAPPSWTVRSGQSIRPARRRLPTCCAGPPPRRRRRVRVHRKYTDARPGWQWVGARKTSPAWMGLFSVDEAVLKAIEVLWAKSVAESSILARVKALGQRVLRSFTDAIERTLYPDTEKELVVEYGLTDPSPADKTFVDPLREWETSKVTYYRDSFGRPVYLQLDGATGFVAAGDYRDQFDEMVDVEEDPLEGDPREGLSEPSHDLFNILGHDDATDSPEDTRSYTQRPRDDTRS